MFESILDWSDEQGLPFRAWAEALEEKGIPPFALVLIPLVVVGVAAFFLLNQGPATGSVVITAVTVSGDPLSGVSVTLTNAANFNASKTTGASGKASFDNVPVGTVNVNAYSPSVPLTDSNFYLDVVAGQLASKTVSSSLQTSTGVSLMVDVQNVDSATITVLDSNGNVMDPGPVADTTSYSFSVAGNADYTVKAEAPGFDTASQTVHMGDSTQQVNLIPTKSNVVTQAHLHVRVVQTGVAANPVPNATVRILQSDALLTRGTSSDDGSVEVLNVPYNATVQLAVNASGFSESVQDINITTLEQTVVVSLSSLSPALSGLRVTVQDGAGNAVYSPIVRLYQNGKQVSESLPEDGVALFNKSWSPALSLTVYKSGFFPLYLPRIVPDQMVTLNASGNQSPVVHVHVSDWRGKDDAQVSVMLQDSAGHPLGIPARLTSSVGVQVFGDVPSESIRVQASDGHRVKFSPVFVPTPPSADSNETDVELQFDPLSVAVPVSVVDHFSRGPIADAQVSAGNGTCSTNPQGLCSLSVDEADNVMFHASADGYLSLDSAGQTVYPGIGLVPLELTSDSVSNKIALRFDGVYDSSGRKVNSLSPLSEYEAHYALSSPSVGFTKAEAQVILSGSAVVESGKGLDARITKSSPTDSSALPAVPPVTITSDGFSQNSFDVVQGGSVTFINQDNATHFLAFGDGQSLTVPQGQNRSLVFNKVGGFAFKSLDNPSLSGFLTVTAMSSSNAPDANSVLFEYAPFNGSRQIVVRFKTGQSGDVTLTHRSAFFTPTDTLRSPSDGLDTSGHFLINFAGTCTDTLCVQFYFQRSSLRSSPSVNVPWGQSATLVVNVFGLTSAAALQVSGTPSLKFLSATSNSSLGLVSDLVSSVRLNPGSSAAEFSFQTVRLSKNAPLHINVTQGSVPLFDGDAFVVVYSPSTPSLFVTVSPKSVQALTPSQVRFTVKDFLGQPVEGAHVTLGTSDVQASDNVSGVYSIDSVNPDSLASIPFQVTADGFRPFSGSVPVLPPDKAVDVTPASVSISVDSATHGSGSVTMSNLLSDDLHVSASTTVDSGGDLTDVSTSVSSLLLKAKSSASLDLTAAIKDSVLQVANKVGVLKDHVRGTLHLRFSGRGYSNSVDVPFTVDATQSQSSLDDDWTLSPDSLQFNLQPPKKKTDSVDVTIANNAPYAMVFNLQQSLGLSVQPASLTLAAATSGTVKVKANLPPEIDCFSQDLNKKGTLTVYGSFQGLSSTKNAAIALDVSTTQLSCQPPSGYRLTLPVDVRLTFLANSRTKSNADGSTSVLLPNRELLWFAPGASVTPVDATLPQGTAFVLDQSHVQALPQGGWTIQFPTGVLLNIPTDADRQPFGAGQTIVTLDNAQVILPPGVQAQTPQTGVAQFSALAGIVVPPLAPVTFRPIPFNYDALTNLLPPDSVEVKLPTDAVLDLLPGTTERKQTTAKAKLPYPLPKPVADSNLQNVKAIQLPTGEAVAFGDAAAIVIAKNSVTIPAGTSIYVTRSRVVAINGLPIADAFQLTMPVSYALTVIGTNKAFKTQDGQNALKIADNAVVQASWSLSVSKATAGAASVLRVVHDNALKFLKGASAAIPYDPASVAKCSLGFTPPSAVTFALPKGTGVQKTSNGYEAVLPACDDTSRLVFSITKDSGSSEFFQSPSVKKITFPSDSEFVVGDIKDDGEKSIRTTGAIQYVACLKDSTGKAVPDNLKEAKFTFSQASLLALPDRVLGQLKANPEKVDLGALTPVSFASGASSLVGMGGTKILKILANGQKITGAFPPAFTSSGLIMPKGSAVAFVPECTKGSGRLDVSATAEDVFVALDNQGTIGTLEVNFSNKNPEQFKQKIQVCLFNNGNQLVTLDHLESIPDSSVAVEHQDYFKAIADPSANRAYFSQPGAFGIQQRLPVEPSVAGGDNCRKFTLEFNLPPDLVWQDKCIVASRVPLSMTGSMAFKFTDVNGEPFATSDKHSLPIKLNFDAKEADCQISQQQAQFKDLNGISVNYDQDELKGIGTSSDREGLFFKNEGHVRYFAIVNNEPQAVTVKEVTGAGMSLMSCSVLDGQQKPSQPLAANQEIKAAGVLVVSCTSSPGSPGKDGPFVIKFNGSSPYGLDKTINVHVFPVVKSSSLYSATPMGRTLPYFSSTQATSKDLTQAGFASYQSWSFADPVQTANVPAPVANAQTPATPGTPATTAAGTAPAANAAGTKPATDAAALAAAKKQALISSIDFRLCKKFFCTRGQAESAVQSFVETFSQMIDSQLKKNGPSIELPALNDFCRSLTDGNTFEKSMLLQLTNVQLTQDASRAESLNLANAYKTRYFPDMKQVVVTSSGGGEALFSGCGMYRVSARLNAACAIQGKTPLDWKNNMQVELNVQKLKSCDVNLANAALLTADSPFAYTGNELGTGPLGAIKQVGSFKTLSAAMSLFTTPFSNDKNKLMHELEAFGALRQGVLGQYGSDTNVKDEATARALYSAMYSADATKSTLSLCPTSATDKSKPCAATYYDDAAFCWKTGGPVFKTLGGTIIAITVLQFAVASAQGAATGGAGLAFGFKALATNYRLMSTLSACGAGVGANLIHGKSASISGSCQTLDLCTSAFLAGAIESIPIPGIGNVGVNAAQRFAISQASLSGAVASGFGSVLIQSAIGAGIISGLEEISGPAKNPSIPVVPITVLVRQGFNPYKVNAAGAAVKRYVVQVGGLNSRNKQINDLALLLEQKGFYGPQGRTTAQKVLGILYDAGGGDISKGFDESAIKAMSVLEPKDAKTLEAQINRVKPGNEGTIITQLANNWAAKDLPFAQNKLMTSMGLDTIEGDSYSVFKSYFNSLDPLIQDRLARHPDVLGVQDFKIFYSSGKPKDVNLVQAMSAESRIGTAGTSIVRVEPSPSLVFQSKEAESVVARKMMDLLANDPKIFEGHADLLVQGTRSVQTGLIKSKLSQIKALPDQDLFIQKINKQITDHAYDLKLNAFSPGKIDDTAGSIADLLKSGRLNSNALQSEFETFRVGRLPSGFNGLTGLLEESFQKVSGTSVVDGLKKGIKVTQFYDQKGTRTILSSNVLADAEKTKEEAKKGLQELLTADSKAARLTRMGLAGAGILSSLLFNTDFRPVQVRVLSDQSNAHIIAVHSEGGIPTAASICIQGVAQECAASPTASTPGVLDYSKLCPSTSNICLRLLQWPTGDLNAYALLAGFNDQVTVDAPLLASIFQPETAPIADKDFDRLKLSGQSVDFKSVSLSGFSSYQLDAADPKDAGRKGLSDQAQALVDRMNDPNNVKSIKVADRNAIKSLANRAIAAFNNKQDDEGIALLNQAQTAANAATGVNNGSG